MKIAKSATDELPFNWPNYRESSQNKIFELSFFLQNVKICTDITAK
jgi:hypothetical protein